MSGSWAVVTVEQMRALEAAAFAAGVAERQLQANAAAEIADVLAERGERARLVVLVGPGNNGRDAFLAGRILVRRGWQVLHYLAPRDLIEEGELFDLRRPGERWLRHRGEAELEVLRRELLAASFALDGLLGIGVRGPMRSPLDAIARLLNHSAAGRRPIVTSVDVPSGIDADSGEVAEEAVRADLTIALGAVKGGCLRFPAASRVGELIVRPIGLPEAAERACQVRLLSRETVASLVPPRPLESHKGSLGWVIVVGGSRDYVGAPVLSGAAAARSGCGLVALAVPQFVRAAAAATLPEAIFALREEDQAPELHAEQLLSRIGEYRAILIGPGLGREERNLRLVRALLTGLRGMAERPTVVIDADALYALATWPEWWAHIPAGCVLTPHVGEMARLSGASPADIGRRAWELAQKKADDWQQLIVLKSAHTVVTAPAADAWVFPGANPALATAGSGDVLAGLMAGLAAQGATGFEAARLAVVAHALAARRAQAERARRSLIASDLLSELPVVLAELDARCGGSSAK